MQHKTHDQEIHGQQELEWLAFCYIAGEMSSEDREAFEARLGESQQAREALARAVELTHALAACEQKPLSAPAPAPTGHRTRRRRWRLVAGWSAVAAASACLALAVTPHVFQGPHRASHPLALRDAGQLVDLWAASMDVGDPLSETEPAGLLANGEADDEFGSRESLPLSVPDWMLAAVTTAREHPVDDGQWQTEGPQDN